MVYMGTFTYIYHQYTPNVTIYIPYMDPMGWTSMGTFFWSEKTDVHPRYPDWNNQNSRWNSGCSSHIVGKSGTCVFLDPQIPPCRKCFFEDKVSIFMGLSKTRVSPNAIVKYVIFLLAWPFIEITPPFSDTTKRTFGEFYENIHSNSS